MKTRLMCVSVLFLACAWALEGGEPKKSPEEIAEEKEAEEEEQLMVGKRPESGHEFSARGRLQLVPLEEGKIPKILGTFTSDRKTYLVKITNEALFAQLLPFDKKDVGLGGKVRNSGKYLIVEEVLAGSGTPAASFRNPRGL